MRYYALLITFFIASMPLPTTSTLRNNDRSENLASENSTNILNMLSYTNQTSYDQLKSSIKSIADNPANAVAPAILGTVCAMNSQIIQYAVNNIVNVFSWIKNSIIRYDYTVEEAEPEITAIVTADKIGCTEEKDAAITQHYINTLNSLSGNYYKLLSGNPNLEQHAATLAPYAEEYAKFLLCINRYHKYGKLQSVIQEKKLDPEYGECLPPYNIQLYNYPEKKHLAEFIKKLTTCSTDTDNNANNVENNTATNPSSRG